MRSGGPGAGRRHGRLRPDGGAARPRSPSSCRPTGRAGDLVRLHAGLPGFPGADQPADAGRDGRGAARTGGCGRPRRRVDSAAEYAAAARPLIDADLAATGWALVVGGTGLYLRAALAPLAVPAPGDPEVRARLRAAGRVEGAEALHAELARLDPEAAAGRSTRGTCTGWCARSRSALAGGPGRWSGRDDLWEPAYRHPTLVVGLDGGPRGALRAHRRAARAGCWPRGRWRRSGAIREEQRRRTAPRRRAAPRHHAAPSATGRSAPNSRGERRATRPRTRSPRPRGATLGARSPGCASSRTLLS